MKKSRILSALLVFIMMCGTFLGNGYVTLAADNDYVVEEETQTVAEKTLKANAFSQVESGSMTAPLILNSKTEFPEFTVFDYQANTWTLTPIVAEYSGLMYFDFATASNGYSSDYVTAYVVTDYTYENGILNYTYLEDYTWNIYSGDDKALTGQLPVNKGDKYYILILANQYNKAAITAGACGYVFSTGTRTLYQGTSKWTYASGKNKNGENNTTYFKVKPDRTGVMTVTLSELGYSTSTGYVTLCNSNKKALSNKVYYSSSGNKVYFGVKKNTTYYLKVTDCCGSYDNAHVYGIKYGMTTRTDRAIGTKSNAKKLYRKADATNTLFTASTSNSTDWYKIYVSSKRKTQITINTSSIKSGSVYVTFYKGTKKLGSATIGSSSNGGTWTLTYGTTYGKANAGTYYIKVVKGTKASGKYSIRYKQ